MNSSLNYASLRSILAGAGLLIGLTSTSTAQTPLDAANESIETDYTTDFYAGEDAQVPLFFEDEMEDIGPQYILKPGLPAHEWFRAVIDSQWLYTSNPTLASDETASSTDLFVFTGQFAVAPRSKDWQGGKIDSLTGYRYQLFRYAALTDDKLINTSPASENNFEAHTIFSDLKWTRDKWTAKAGLRFTRLDNSDNGGGFYTELVPSWLVSRNVTLNSTTLLSLRYDGALVLSESEAFRLQRDDFNDRVSQNFSANLTHQIMENFFFQPSIRANYSIYTNDPNGDREDITLGISGAFTYRWGTRASARFSTSYQTRESNGVGIVDYSNLDIGWGANFSFRF